MRRNKLRARALLLQFAVENHLSLHGRQQISFVASSLKDNNEGLIASPGLDGEAILPAVIVYGANASGKSNLFSALGFMMGFILNSHSRGEPGGPTNRTPFALCKTGSAKPTSFALDFIVDDVRYNYSFDLDGVRVLRESLYHFPNGRIQMLFDRTKDEFEFGRALRGRNKVIGDLTRPNSLFLSAAAQNGHEMLTPLVTYIRGIDSREIEPRDDDAEIDRKIVEFLASVGTGISDLKRSEVDVDEKALEVQRQLNDMFKKILDSKIDLKIEPKQKKIEFGHRANDGTTIYFDMNQESEGTRRLLRLLRLAFCTLNDGQVLLVDEISNSLHTKACEQLVALFCNRATNPKGAQLLAATHDTNLLHAAFLRRDQVWFAEKDEVGETHIYPLTDIKTRKEDDLEKGYLQGRYGAVPFAGSTGDFLP